MISNFGVHESPFASVVLLDTSGSMESRLSLGRSAAIRFLDGLRPEDVAAVYKFDYKIEQVQDFSSGRDLAPMAFAIKGKRDDDAVRCHFRSGECVDGASGGAQGNRGLV